jgi:hypothetical protein
MTTRKEGRTLLNFQPLPKRDRVLDREQVDTDIRDALAKAESRLNNMAQRYGVNGWQIDTDSGVNGYEFGVVDHTVVGRLRLRRAE